MHMLATTEIQHAKYGHGVLEQGRRKRPDNSRNKELWPTATAACQFQSILNSDQLPFRAPEMQALLQKQIGKQTGVAKVALKLGARRDSIFILAEVNRMTALPAGQARPIGRSKRCMRLERTTDGASGFAKVWGLPVGVADYCMGTSAMM